MEERKIPKWLETLKDAEIFLSIVVLVGFNLYMGYDILVKTYGLNLQEILFTIIGLVLFVVAYVINYENSNRKTLLIALKIILGIAVLVFELPFFIHFTEKLLPALKDWIEMIATIIGGLIMIGIMIGIPIGMFYLIFKSKKK